LIAHHHLNVIVEKIGHAGTTTGAGRRAQCTTIGRFRAARSRKASAQGGARDGELQETAEERAEHDRRAEGDGSDGLA